MKQTLYGDPLLSIIERLAPELGRTDRDRLTQLAALAIEPPASASPTASPQARGLTSKNKLISATSASKSTTPPPALASTSPR